MPKVFVTQYRPNYNYDSLAEFGEVVFVFPELVPINYNNTKALTKMAKEALADATEEDFFVLSCPMPILFGIALSELHSRTNEDTKCLRWCSAKKVYLPTFINTQE